MAESSLCQFKTVGLVVFSMSVIVILVMQYRQFDSSSVMPMLKCAKCKCSENDQGADTRQHKTCQNADFQNDLVDIGKSIAEAYNNARSAKTLAALTHALQKINYRLSQMEGANFKIAAPTNKLSSLSDDENQTSEKPDVCPEEYLGKLDHPIMEHGWEFKKCDAKPLASIVTLVLNAWTYTKDEVNTVVQQIQDVYPSLPLHVSTSEDLKNGKTVKVISDPKKHGWKTLIDGVNTKYVVILEDVHRFTNYSSIERLVSISSRFNVPIVGAATVGYNGHWWHGCYQIHLKNYTLIYRHGYDFSRDSCWFCEHMSGPFLAKTNFLKSAISPLSDDNIMFTNMFLSLRQQDTIIMGCPDVMFHVDKIVLEKEETKNMWLPLVKKNTINKLTSYSEKQFSFSCSDLGITCNGFGTFKGVAVPICCLELLNICAKKLMQFALQSKVLIEMRCGTLLGSLKFEHSLPWDIDADFHYWTGNYTALMNLKSALKPFGCSLSGGGIGAGSMGANGWYTDVTRAGALPSLYYVQRTGYNQTFTLYDGAWLQAPPNPGRIMRIDFNADIYKHANSHRHTGTGMHADYVPGSFISCPKKGFHACLDQFYADGSFQFT